MKKGFVGYIERAADYISVNQYGPTKIRSALVNVTLPQSNVARASCS
jgi:hypothetical protein